MVEISLVELFFRTIPETFLFILAGYLFHCKKIDKTKLFISTIVLSMSIYLVRMLPIHYGVHTVINIVNYIFISVLINKIPVEKAISYCLVLTIILFICEWINLILLYRIINIGSKELLNTVIGKIFYSLPSLLLFAIAIFIFYSLNYKKKREGISNVFR